jgi:uroporphyrinogen-III decarboxylase
MCEDYSEWLPKVFEFIGNTFKYDFMSFAEDMSYNNGPMLSKAMFDEFLAPYYNKVIPYIKKADIPVMLDSDGDITLAVDWYAEVGVDGMFPLERQTGVDVGLYIQKRPERAFLGHYDKMIMNKGEAALRAEFERLMPSVKNGRYILGVDHQTPPGVSYDDYKLFVKLFKEYSVI